MKKILLVDEATTFLDREKSILNRSDFKIFTASSSEKALAMHKVEKMDLIVVSLDMRHISGDTLCSMIRSDEGTKRVSIIIVCNNTKADLDRVSRCKANTYVSRPIRPLLFLEKVSQFLDIPARKCYRVLLKVKVNGNTGNESFFCSSRNISVSGILIETDKYLEKGSNVTCSFFLPGESRTSVSVDGEIVRAAKTSADLYQFGIRFNAMETGDREAITAFVNRQAPVF
jgi:DNA-binding response OmpR family regulator